MLRNGVTKRSSGVKDPLILLMSCSRRPSMYRRRGAGGVTIDFRCSQMKRHAVGHCRHGARAPSGRLKITNEVRGDDLDGELDHAACNAARLRCLQYGPPPFSATFPPITRLAATFQERTLSMRHVKVCSACGKPTTVASTSCLWCGQPKKLFSFPLVATLKAAVLVMMGFLVRRGRTSRL